MSLYFGNKNKIQSVNVALKIMSFRLTQLARGQSVPLHRTVALCGETSGKQTFLQIVWELTNSILMYFRLSSDIICDI